MFLGVNLRNNVNFKQNQSLAIHDSMFTLVAKSCNWLSQSWCVSKLVKDSTAQHFPNFEVLVYIEMNVSVNANAMHWNERERERERNGFKKWTRAWTRTQILEWTRTWTRTLKKRDSLILWVSQIDSSWFCCILILFYCPFLITMLNFWTKNALFDLSTIFFNYRLHLNIF